MTDLLGDLWEGMAVGPDPDDPPQCWVCDAILRGGYCGCDDYWWMDDGRD